VKLYKKDAKGATRVWEIYQTGDDEFQWEHGTLNGEMQFECKQIEAKAGRTDQEQIDLEMNSKIEKRKDSGYVEDIDKISSVLKNQLGFEKQMKAKLLKDGDVPNIVYGGYSHMQRKLNGHRCTVVRQNGTVMAYSTGGKLILSIEHILSSINISEGQKIDGELYIHGLSLQKISSMVRKQKEQSPDLIFMMFDQILDLPFIDRFNSIPNGRSNCCILCETIQVKDFDHVKRLFIQFRREKYEGGILRHGKLGYKFGKNANRMYKIKKLDGEGYYDEEFEVIRILSSVEGWARLVCLTGKGAQFKVSCHGNHYEKREVLENKENYIGKFVKIEFPEYTDAGIPSQPVAIMWRNKDEE